MDALASWYVCSTSVLFVSLAQSSLAFQIHRRPTRFAKCTIKTKQAELDLKTKRWAHVDATGVPPSARSKCTMSTTGDRVVVFGGEGAFQGYDCPGNVRSSRSVFNDLFSYSAQEYHWEGLPIVGSPPTKQVPGPRRGHTATTHCTPNGDALLVFGGCGPEPIRGHDKYMNDLWFLDLHSHVWTKLE